MIVLFLGYALNVGSHITIWIMIIKKYYSAPYEQKKSYSLYIFLIFKHTKILFKNRLQSEMNVFSPWLLIKNK